MSPGQNGPDPGFLGRAGPVRKVSARPTLLHTQNIHLVAMQKAVDVGHLGATHARTRIGTRGSMFSFCVEIFKFRRHCLRHFLEREARLTRMSISEEIAQVSVQFMEAQCADIDAKATSQIPVNELGCEPSWTLWWLASMV